MAVDPDVDHQGEPGVTICEIEAEDLVQTAQPVAQRIRVHVQGSRRDARVAERVQVDPQCPAVTG